MKVSLPIFGPPRVPPQRQAVEVRRPSGTLPKKRAGMNKPIVMALFQKGISGGLPSDARELSFTRGTQPGQEIKLLLEKLKLTLPAQAPPKITGEEVARTPVV